MQYRKLYKVGQIVTINFANHERLTKAHLAIAQDSNDCTITKQDHICCWPLLAACEFMCATIREFKF